MASARAAGAAPDGAVAAEWLVHGQHTVLLTPAGAGFSAFEDCLLTVWRDDPVETPGGFALYLRDRTSGEVWSACGGALPGQAIGRLVRGASGLTLEREHSQIHCQVDIELREVGEVRSCHLTNRSERSRRIELTSYIEVALDHPAAFDGHPAFSKLFVQTRWLEAQATLVASRRPRGHGDSWPFLAHSLLDAQVSDFLTDRASFIGRGRDLDAPQALSGVAGLGRGHGNVLDPALSLRTEVTLKPGESRTLRFVLAAGRDLQQLMGALQGLRTAPAVPALSVQPRRLWLELARAVSAPTCAQRPVRALVSGPLSEAQEAPAAMQLFNGFGGFSEDGREYRIHITCEPDGSPRLPPAPWTNVIANARLGFLVSERGAGCIWGSNSREHRITPWRNDAVMDPSCDALYIRDEDSGEFWSPLPGPSPAGNAYDVRHGFGYSTWKHRHAQIHAEVSLFVPHSDPLRVARLHIGNTGSRKRRLALYAYNQWVLGSTPEATRADVTTEFSSELGAVLARNPQAPISPRGIAFAALSGAALSDWSADRVSFLGSPGSSAAPAALLGDGRLSQTHGDEHCAVLRGVIEIEPGSSHELAFLIGEADSHEELSLLLARYRSIAAIDEALDAVRRTWTETFSALQVKTPSQSLDLLVNGWLPYQNLACRLRARTAFYQSGGAFGFRDQIQDASALVFIDPQLTRAQILLHAAHQFVEGDVMHWWHPPHDRGMRTRFADDLLWLPWIAAYYIRITGDAAVLDEQVHFVAARSLEPGEDEVYLQVHTSSESADLYEHCCRAIERSLARGVHGLPLFGTGDWNDGMNRVGREGKGESVWMGFFLYTVLGDFLALCEQRDDQGRLARYRAHREALQVALNADGWDGQWYRRGWYDNGAVLGSHASDECRIDALVQAWSVISKAAPAERAAQALDSAEKHLIDEHEHLIRLLAPPFVNTPNDPGYIKGYVAGVRENGGQYTHAALWVVRAMAELGRRERAMQLLEGINPITHTHDRKATERYKVEPYVVAADIYGAEPHIGRGGWTWYTGSAGWMYRVAIETLLGFSIEGGKMLCLEPRIPDSWDGFEISYRNRDGTRILIEARNPDRAAARIVSATLDGTPLRLTCGALKVALPRTAGEHRVVVFLGA